MYGVMYCTCNPLCVGVQTLIQVFINIILIATFVESKLDIDKVMSNLLSVNIHVGSSEYACIRFSE